MAFLRSANCVEMGTHSLRHGSAVDRRLLSQDGRPFSRASSSPKLPSIVARTCSPYVLRQPIGDAGGNQTNGTSFLRQSTSLWIVNWSQKNVRRELRASKLRCCFTPALICCAESCGMETVSPLQPDNNAVNRSGEQRGYSMDHQLSPPGYGRRCRA